MCLTFFQVVIKCNYIVSNCSGVSLHKRNILQVIAEELHTNPRLSSKASVTVSVLDVNDNAPIFESPVYSTKISESAVRGTPITTITAMDRDTGRYELLYLY